MASIPSFRGPYSFLSNFFIEPDGSHVEREYQMAKCASYLDRRQFDGVSPKVAKAIGQRVKLRPDWEDVKLEIMHFYVTKKFKDHPALLAQLKATYPHYLEEGNYWGDRYWGTVRGEGENMLGVILMDVRLSL